MTGIARTLADDTGVRAMLQQRVSANRSSGLNLNVMLNARDVRGLDIKVPYFRDTHMFAAAKAKIKQPLGTLWDTQRKTWYADGPEVVLDMERAGIRYDFVSAAAAQRVRGMLRDMDAALASRDRLTEGMYGYQAAGSEYLYWAKRAILADGMGLGKSKQAIDALRYVWGGVGPVPTLVVVLKTLLYNWEDEFAKWMSGVPVQVMPSGAAKRGKFWKTFREQWQASEVGYGPIVVTNYEALALADWPDDIAWGVVIADEATYIKNAQALRSRAFYRVAEQAEYVWLLTGTPIEIRYEELYGLFRYIRPAVFGGFARFRDEHLLTDWYGSITGVRNRHMLAERIAPWLLRRTKEQVALQLPPKLYTDYRVELAQWQQRGYDRLRYDFEEWLAEQGADYDSQAIALVQILRLQQYTSSPRLFDIDDDLGAKFLALRDILAEWDGLAMVFTRFSEMAYLLRKHLALPDRAIIAGDVDARDRLQRIKDFNAGQLGDVLVSTDAGAHGLNVTGADLIVHYDMLWNPAKMRQREDRLHRIGQTKAVNVLRLLVPQTIDVGMAAVADDRQILADTTLDDADEVMVRKLNLKKLAKGEYNAA